ncbi:MAG: SsrA-binding protein, partial [Abditibacteriota bacterium]|nr:SsrA-binding protein [Abditibacteriota bacterium]
GMHIAPYEQGNISNLDPLRQRKLLLHAAQLEKIRRSTQEKGFAAVPLKIYFKHTYAKLLIGIGQGKKLWDKREDLTRKDAERQMDRALKERRR